MSIFKGHPRRNVAVGTAIAATLAGVHFLSGNTAPSEKDEAALAAVVDQELADVEKSHLEQNAAPVLLPYEENRHNHIPSAQPGQKVILRTGTEEEFVVQQRADGIDVSPATPADKPNISSAWVAMLTEQGGVVFFRSTGEGRYEVVNRGRAAGD